MIINKYGRIVVLVGETFEYEGAEYRCEVYEKSSPVVDPCSHCFLLPLGDPCCALECNEGGRIDEKNVVFVKVKGGEDERK